MIDVAGLGIHLRHQEGEGRAIFRRTGLRQNSHARHAIEDVGIDHVSRAIFLRSFLILVAREVHRRQIVVEGRSVGLQRQCVLIILRRLAVVLLHLLDKAVIVPRFRAILVHLQRLVERLLRVLVLLQEEVRHAQLVIAKRGRILFERGAIVVDGVEVTLLSAQQVALMLQVRRARADERNQRRRRRKHILIGTGSAGHLLIEIVS